MNATNQFICRHLDKHPGAMRPEIELALGGRCLKFGLASLDEDGFIYRLPVDRTFKYYRTEKPIPACDLRKSGLPRKPKQLKKRVLVLREITQRMRPGVGYSVTSISRLMSCGMKAVDALLAAETPGLDVVTGANGRGIVYILAGTQGWDERAKVLPMKVSPFGRGDYRDPGLTAENPRSHWAMAMAARGAPC